MCVSKSLCVSMDVFVTSLYVSVRARVCISVCGCVCVCVRACLCKRGY